MRTQTTTYQNNITANSNMLSVVSDRLFSTESSVTTGLVDFYSADLVSASDYYPGVYAERSRSRMGMYGRGKLGSADGYRYGFNGMEKDDEVKGDGNSYTAEYWQYDSRLGRRWNIDPVNYPWQSSYASFNNNPIYFADPRGLEGEPKTHKVQKGDNLTSIAKEYGVSQQDIIDANKTDWGIVRRHGNQNWVFTGESLNIPSKNESKEASNSSTPSINYTNIPPKIDLSNVDFTKKSKPDKTEITLKPLKNKALPQDGVLQAASIVGSASYIAVNQAIKTGFWLGSNTKGVLNLYSSFNGNQYVVKTDVHIVNLKTKVKIGNHIVSLLIMTNDASNYLNAVSEEEKSAALNKLYFDGAIWIVSAISAEAIVIMGAGALVIAQPETQFIIDQDLIKKMNDHSYRLNYRAKQAYEERHPKTMPSNLVFKQGR